MAVKLKETARRSEPVRTPWASTAVSAGRRESLIARAGFGTIALPTSSTTPSSSRSPGRRRVTTSSAAPCPSRSRSPWPWSIRASVRGYAARSRSASASSLSRRPCGSSPPRRPRAARRETTLRGFSALLGGLVLAAVGTSVLWRSRRSDESRTRRYLRRSSSRSRIRRRLRARGAGRDRLRCRPQAPLTGRRGRSRPPPRRRLLPDCRRPDARRLVCPVAERRGGDRVPRSLRPARPRPDARFATATASCSSIAGVRARATATTTRSAGRDEDLLAAIAFLQARPDVDPERIGGLGLSVEGSSSWKRRPRQTTSRRSSPTGPATAPSASSWLRRVRASGSCSPTTR